MALLLTILGIGLLLLLHEAGHYFAARAVGIKVHVFSLGFGPRIIGWHRNGCDFRLAWIPLGGYVRVAGEDPNREPRPGDLFYASAPQRLLFYSGGIIINFLFAFLMIPLLFFAGVPFEAPLIGSVTAGGAAWEAGLRPGDRVIDVDGRSIHGFRHVHAGIALAPQGSPVPMTVQAADGTRRQIQVLPSYDDDQGIQGIGIRPMTEAMFGQDGGRILSIDGVPIVDDPLMTQVMLARILNRAEDVAITFEGEDGTPRSETLTPETSPIEGQPLQIGVAPLVRQVVQARGPLADVFPTDAELLEVNGMRLRGLADLLFVVHQEGGIRSLSYLAPGTSTAVSTTLPELLAISPQDVASHVQLASSSEVRYGVSKGSAAALAGLEDGFRVLRLDGTPMRSFEELRDGVQEATLAGRTTLSMSVVRAGTEAVEDIQLTMLQTPIPRYEIWQKIVVEEVQTASPIAATRLGFLEARSMISEVFTFLKRMLTGEIAAEKNLGGIITIGTATHSFANQGLIPLLFFLCLISVNLGVLNLLPIPALDGGHMLFAIYEIIARRPVSMVVQNSFQVVGVFVVLFLLVFVTFLDIQRLFA